MFEPFWNIADQLVPFTEKEKGMVNNKLVIRQVPKNYRLVDLGQTAKELYFIVKGCIRLYYITEEGKQITGFIFTENLFAGSLESMISQSSSVQILETLEACDLIVIPYTEMQWLYESVPKTNILIRKLLEQRMINAQKVVAALIMNKPEDRYRSFLEMYPELLNRIPHHMLSSFMGITPVSMSRIRKRITEDN